jgi:RNA polymerase sigma-32 factor
MTHDLPFTTPNGLERYLRLARGARKLDRQEELLLVERFRAHGDLEARRELLTANLRAVAAIAFKYRRYGVPLDELVAEGNLALVHALSRFDPARGTRFMTYAAFWVRAHVLNHVVCSFSMVGAGSGVLRTKMFFKLRRERARISNLVGEGEHADALLARSVGVKVDTVRDMLAKLEQRDASLEATTAPGAPSLGERLVAPEPDNARRDLPSSRRGCWAIGWPMS